MRYFIAFSIIHLKTVVLYDVTRIAWRAGVILASELCGDFLEKIIAAFFDFWVHLKHLFFSQIYGPNSPPLYNTNIPCPQVFSRKEERETWEWVWEISRHPSQNSCLGFFSADNETTMASSTNALKLGGYDYKFTGNVPDNFKCLVCLLPMKDPVQIVGCGHRLCSICLESLFR